MRRPTFAVAVMTSIFVCASLSPARCGGAELSSRLGQNGQELEKEATVQEREGNDYLKEAQRLRKHANDLRGLAKRFADDAERTTNPTLKKQDLDDAEDYRAQAYWVDEDAKKLEQRAADKLEKAKGLRAQAAKLKEAADAAEGEKAKPAGTRESHESAPLREMAAKLLAFQDIAGVWRWAPQSGADTRDDVVTIAYKDKRKSSLVLQGSYKDWEQEGPYTNGKIRFVRKVGATEMGTGGPDWAPELVAKQGTLKWRLVLSPVDRCGEVQMKGEFYPGEISWREETDSETGDLIKREAFATGKSGKPSSLGYQKESSAVPDIKMEEGVPGIAVHPEDADMAGYQTDSIFKTQPFLVVVTLPRAAAERTGASLKVRFTTSASHRTASFALNAGPAFKDGKGPVEYSTWSGIFIADDGMVQSHTRLPFIGPINEGWRRVELNNLVNGEQVTVSYETATAKFKIYNSWVQQAIARHEQGFQTLEALYRALLDDPELPAEARDRVQLRLEMIANARRIIAHRAGPTENFTDYSRFKVGDVYHRLLLENSSSWELRKDVTPDRFGVRHSSKEERLHVGLALDEAEQSYKDMYTHVIKGLSLTMYQLAVQGTPLLERSLIAVFHIDSMGQPVNVVGLVLNAVGLAAEYAVLRLQVDVKNLSSNGRLRRAPKRFPEAGRTSGPSKSSPPEGRTAGGGNTAGPVDEMNLAEAREVYGPAAEFVPYETGQKIALQIDNYACSVEVARQMARSAGVRVPPEGMLLEELGMRYETPLEPMFVEQSGTTRGGFEYLIKKLQGSVASREATLNEIRGFLDAGYMVKATLVTMRSTKHAIRVREVARGPDGRLSVVFDDPWTGQRTRLPACDFEFLRPDQAISVVDFGQVPKTP